MEATLDGAVVRAGEQARERFYDSRGYGCPVEGGNLAMAPVEAAHLLYRGDLAAVVDESEHGDSDGAADTGRRLSFRAFLATSAVSEVAFQVYKDLRDRGFYLAPASLGESGEGGPDGDTTTFEVYPRGAGPWDDAVAYRVRPVSEREGIPAEDLLALADVGGGVDATDDVADDAAENAADAEDTDDAEDAVGATGVLAVVDEESELTYLEVTRPTVAGSTHHELPQGVAGELLADRVLVPGAPAVLHDRAFYGQRLDEDADLLQLSLVEAAFLAGQGVLEVAEDRAGDQAEADGDGQAALIARGREVEGDRFDRRLRAYSALRTAGVVPKTGFKFGADFRTYANVESVDELGHSELLVRVLEPGHEFSPIDLALDVRLAHGVRKRMVYALTGPDAGIEWVSVERLTP